jgi:indolepyruvate ferredoxin oxidoreductase alpha subunit
VDIEAVVKAIGVKHVTKIKPYKLKKSITAVKEAIEYRGVSVIISEEMCTLYAKGLKKLKARAFAITDKCTNHRDCINEIGCPAFYLEGERVKMTPTPAWVAPSAPRFARRTLFCLSKRVHSGTGKNR